MLAVDVTVTAWPVWKVRDQHRRRKAARWALEQLDSSMIEGIDAARRAGL
jgi:hypothetical protein